jgi:peptidoglycan DL-endopeptidase LytF
MDRKKTILIAVLINAGLLVLLFVVALHREEETPKSVELAQVLPQDNKPLFNDTPMLTEAPLAQPAAEAVRLDQPQSASPLAAAPLASSAPAEVVHQLPPLAPQEQPLPIAAPSVPSAPQIAAAAQPVEVKVKKGDSLEKIAKAHRTTVDEIIRLNQLPSSFLRIGQVLKLPAERTLHPAKQKSIAAEKRVGDSQPEYYTVKVGDNPWTIAMKHHMKVDELLKVNNLNEEKARRLKPGDRLRIR